jgi:hypothetical protein
MAQNKKQEASVIIGKLEDGDNAINVALPAKFKLRKEAKLYHNAHGKESDPCVVYAVGMIGPFKATISLTLTADMARAVGVKLIDAERNARTATASAPVRVRTMTAAELAAFKAS